LHMHPRHAPTPQAILSSNDRYAFMPFSAAYVLIALSIGIGPQAYEHVGCSGSASVTNPLMP